MPFNTLLRDARSPTLLAGARYWNQARGSRDLPRRRDIDPLDIPYLLPNIVMVDVSYDPIDFSDRVVGETVRRFSSGSYLGRSWREIEHRRPESEIFQFYKGIVEQRIPKVSELPYLGPSADFMRVEAAACPLTTDDGVITKIVSFVDYIPKREPVLGLSCLEDWLASRPPSLASSP